VTPPRRRRVQFRAPLSLNTPVTPLAVNTSGNLSSPSPSPSSPGYVEEEEINGNRSGGDNDDTLVEQYGAEGAEDLLGYDRDGLDDDDEEEDDEDEDLSDPGECQIHWSTLGGPVYQLDHSAQFLAFKTRISTQAAIRSEGNRRKGGIKTQQSVVKFWNVRSRSPLI
jgi:hypothetical protein